MTDWHESTIGDVITLQRGFDITRSKQRPGNIPVVSSGGIGSYHDTPMATGPGVVIGRKGTLGKVFYLPSDYWPHDTTLWVKDFKGNNPKFVYYFLQTMDFLSMDVGTSNPTLNRNHVHPTQILWTSPQKQQIIADALGALDDKIAVNESIADTSRKLGVALYKQSADSKPRTITIEGLSTYLNRGQAPKYTEDEDGMIVLNQRCVRAGRVLLDPARLTLAARVQQERSLRPGDVLVNSTGVGTLGRVAIWSHAIQATVDSHVTIVRVNPEVTPTVVGGFAMLAAQQRIEALGEGSTGQTELSKAKLGQLEIDIPAEGSDALAARLTALEEKADAALAEARVLAELRDTILPQLMSGKLRVKDAERIVEDNV
ncbi:MULTISPECIES: restriction endonuclease subunit S [unclassified Nocardiopsis]|uniref:restriction endonuclease subunit S n=1 Tax=Nocardiopsis TaxID=2013 RepID=UPI00387B9392